MTVPTQRDAAGPDTAVQVILARLEGKVDAALARQTAQLEGHDREIADHETRIRTVEAKVPENAQERLQAVESRSAVSWKQLWSVVGGIAAVMTALQPYLNSLHP